MKKYYEEQEDGSIVFCGEILNELNNGAVVLKESCDSDEFPIPAKGDILRLHEMPLDQGGKHATGAAIHDGSHFVAEYEKTFGAWTIQVPKEDNSERIYSIECAETGDIIEDGLTYLEADALIKAYEKEDRETGQYTNGFYAIKEG